MSKSLADTKADLHMEESGDPPRWLDWLVCKIFGVGRWPR